MAQHIKDAVFGADMAEPNAKMLYVGFNETGTRVVYGEEEGYSIYSTQSNKCILSSSGQKAGVRFVDTLYDTSIHAILGGGQNAMIPTTYVKVIDGNWADEKYYNSEVLNVKLVKNLCVLTTAEKLVVFKYPQKKDDELEEVMMDVKNEDGLLAVVRRDKQVVLIAVPALVGDVKLLSYKKGDTKLDVVGQITAHENGVAAIAFHPSGKLLLTASKKGTLIRLWDVETRKLKRVFRRGTSNATITKLVFNHTQPFFACHSLHGTCHIFNYGDVEEQEESGWYSFAKTIVSKVVTTDAAYAHAKIRNIPVNAAITFGRDADCDKVIVATDDCRLTQYKFSLDEPDKVEKDGPSRQLQ